MAKCPSKYEPGSPGAPGNPPARPRRPRLRPTSETHARTRHVPPPDLLCRRGLRRHRLRRRRPAAVHAADRERDRGVLPRHRAHVGGLGGHHVRLRHRHLLDQVRRSLLRRRSAAALQDHGVLGRARRLDHVLGAAAVGVRRHRRPQRARVAPRADSLRGRGDRHRGDVLPLPDGGAQQPVRDLPGRHSARRAGAEPAAAERLHGHPPAVAVHRLRGDDDSVRVRHGGPGHRVPGRLVAARRSALDDGELAVPVARPHARHDLGVRGTGLGRLLGLGPGRERRPAAVVHGHGLPAFGDGAGAPRDAPRLEHDAGHH